MPLLNLDRHVDVKPMHGCSSKREILIHCLDSYGIPCMSVFFLTGVRLYYLLLQVLSTKYGIHFVIANQLQSH